MKKRFILATDLETTGFAGIIMHNGSYVRGGDEFSILQMACKLIDPDGNTVCEYDRLLHTQTDQWQKGNKEFHTKTGFLEVWENSTDKISVDTAIAELISLLTHHLGPLPDYSFDNEVELVLTGKSIWFDREFLTSKAPILVAKLSHQVIDISSLKSVYRMVYPNLKKFSKLESTHFAMDDVNAAIVDIDAVKDNLILLSLRDTDEVLVDATTRILNNK